MLDQVINFPIHYSEVQGIWVNYHHEPVNTWSRTDIEVLDGWFKFVGTNVPSGVYGADFIIKYKNVFFKIVFTIRITRVGYSMFLLSPEEYPFKKKKY